LARNEPFARSGDDVTIGQICFDFQNFLAYHRNFCFITIYIQLITVSTNTVVTPALLQFPGLLHFFDNFFVTVRESPHPLRACFDVIFFYVVQIG